ncbi:MAG: thermonuclease family protein, partial [Armatimonadota bacterium]|nr:thermonuclease family protein [Armatimonadota bacterium]
SLALALAGTTLAAVAVGTTGLAGTVPGTAAPGAATLSAGSSGHCASPPPPPGRQPARVVRVVDGDTLRVALPGGTDRLRLIGVDSPETHDGAKLARDVQRSGRSQAAVRALGAQARAFTLRHLQDRPVGLEFDVQRRDRYGRLLAYVWTPEGELFNLVILREGFAQVLTVPPNVRYTALLLACQRESREQRRGLWGAR